MRLRVVLVLVSLLGACSPAVRDVEVTQALPSSCLAGQPVNAVQVSALGDFPPAPADVAAATPDGRALLSLPPSTRVVSVVGAGPTGASAFGRTAPFELSQLWGGRIAVAYGPLDGLCSTAKLNFARTGHRATRLGSGGVLISGGVDVDGFPVPRLEIYSLVDDAGGAAATFRIVDLGGPTALDPRAALGHAATLLPSGDVLLTGGAPSRNGLADGIAFEGMTLHGPDGLQKGAPGLIGGGPRAFHTAIALTDGRVLLAGGCAQLVAGDCAAGQALDTTSLYDPQTGSFTDGPKLSVARWDHDAVLLGDGSVLLAGGRSEAGAPPLERVFPDGNAVVDGPASGRAALLPTGTVALAGGATASSTVTLVGGPGERVPLAPLPSAIAGHTVTALEDGGFLVAGGQAGPLVVYDALGRPSVLMPFGRTGHSATLLGDGSVLLAGGSATGGASTDAFVYLRSPIGPYVNLPAITFDATSASYVPRRPDHALVVAGHLRLSASSDGAGAPVEWALAPGMQVGDVTLGVFAGREGSSSAAILFGWQSPGSYHFVSLVPGQPVQLERVTVAHAGQTSAAVVDGCQGAALDPAELPDGAVAPFTVEWRSGALTVSTPSRTLMQCSPPSTLAPARGAVGVAAITGVALFDDLTITR